MAKVYDIASPGGRVLDLVADLQKQGRISGVEAQAIHDLIWHPEVPESLRRQAEVAVPGHPPAGWYIDDRAKRRRVPAYASSPVSHETRVIDRVTGADLGCAD